MSLALLCSVIVALMSHVTQARAATRVHALVIANNQPFRSARSEVARSQPALRYADDDAAAFHELIQPIAQGMELLTVMDRETQALYPELVTRAQIPSVEGVRASVARLAARMTLERQGGHRNVAFVFFSGHGVLDAGGRPALALFDGGLSQEFLYREILERLPADEVHLLIDACHAEAVVRPRDAGAERVEVPADQAQAFLVQSTLARFPHAGAIVAASTDSKAHEWDAIRHGVFTYELLSALRGGADVNRDRRIEYSEVYAFIMAANREVSDARARLAVVAKPPDNHRRAPILRLSEFPRAGLSWLANVPGGHGLIEIGDARGRHLATLHGARDSLTDLLVPAGSTLYVRARSGEARFEPRAGQVLAFDSLSFRASGWRARGALEDALRKGLFVAPYGRSYYEGVVDQNPGLISVEFTNIDAMSYWLKPPSAASVALVVGGGLSTGIADVVPLLHGLSVGLRPPVNDGLALSLDLFGAWDGPLAERHLHARGGWVWSMEYGPVRGFGGALAGAGVLSQEVDGGRSRYSASASAGPVLGLSARIDEHFATWSELQLFGLLHRRDDDTVLTLMPCAWLGGALRL